MMVDLSELRAGEWVAQLNDGLTARPHLLLQNADGLTVFGESIREAQESLDQVTADYAALRRPPRKESL